MSKKINIHSGYFLDTQAVVRLISFFKKLNRKRLFAKITRRFQQVARFKSLKREQGELCRSRSENRFGRWEIMYAFGGSLQLIANTLIFATFIGFKSLRG